MEGGDKMEFAELVFFNTDKTSKYLDKTERNEAEKPRNMTK